MKNQIFKDGVLISETSSDVSMFPPNWSAFRMAMLKNAAYNDKRKVVDLTADGARTITRLEAAVMAETPNIEMLTSFWNDFIRSIPALSKPTAANAQQWESIAASAAVPIKFLANGEMAAR